jgi:hypothetical protein
VVVGGLGAGLISLTTAVFASAYCWTYFQSRAASSRLAVA